MDALGTAFLVEPVSNGHTYGSIFLNWANVMSGMRSTQTLVCEFLRVDTVSNVHHAVSSGLGPRYTIRRRTPLDWSGLSYGMLLYDYPLQLI